MATCPECKAPDAYVGFDTVECATTACKYYTDRQAAEVALKNLATNWRAPLETPQEEEDDITDPPSPYYMWVTHHHDFGD